MALLVLPYYVVRSSGISYERRAGPDLCCLLTATVAFTEIYDVINKLIRT